MINVARALYSFWSSFGIPAYPEGTVPDTAELPYITYDLSFPDWKFEDAAYARVWYRDTSFEAITNKLGEISLKLDTGESIKTPSGSVKLFWDDHKIQFQPYDNGSDIKVAYLSYIIAAHTY